MVNRRDVMGGLIALAGAASSMGAGEHWPDSVFNLEKGTTTQAPFGETTVFFDGATGQIQSMVAGSVLLHPGQEPHPPHQHPEEEFMLITEGHGEFVVGGKTSHAGPGTLLYCEGNHEHGIKNTGSTPLRFYYFKWSVGNRT
jgi:mannose-6-phosphate isomerase-like protein (cupin superfamily)